MNIKNNIKHICKGCGKVNYWKPHVVKTKKYCSLECSNKYKMKNIRGENSPRWKGGYIGQNGYKYIRYDGKYRLEHHLVYEKHFNIKVPKGFHVHHKDRDRLNNNIDNLEMMTLTQHKRLHGCKLTESQYEAIKELHKTKKYTHKELGVMFGIDASNITRCINGRKKY